MKRSYAIWMSVVVFSVFGCREKFCVEGLNDAGSDASSYSKYDCSNFGGGTGVHHYHLGGSVSTGGAPATGGTPATGGAATGGAATGGSPATGGDVSTGGAATGGEPATGGAATGGDQGTGGSTGVITWCPDADAPNCLAANQVAGPDAQNVYCGGSPAGYGNYTFVNSCACSVQLASVMIRTSTPSYLQSAALVFTGSGSTPPPSFLESISLPSATSTQVWQVFATPREIPPNASYTVQLSGTICRSDADAPPTGAGVRMTWDGLQVQLSTGLGGQTPLGSYYAVTNTVIAAP